MTELENIIELAREALSKNNTEKALSLLDTASIEQNDEVLFLKGEICFKLQNWGEALNHFNDFLAIHPANAKAESYCAIIQDILKFYHKDLYNP